MHHQAFWTALVLASPGCVVVGEVGSGVAGTRTLQLEDFTALSLHNPIDVRTNEGDAVVGTFTCDDNLLDNVRFVVEGERLVIDTPVGQQMQPRVPCFAEITTVGLESITSNASGDVDAQTVGGSQLAITLSGSGQVGVEDLAGVEGLTIDSRASGDVRVERVAASSLSVTQSGSGNVTVEGIGDQLDLEMSASGDFRGSSLTVMDATVRISGSGDARFAATGTVTGRLSGSGDLTVDGNAVIMVQTTGSGDVR